MRRIAVLPALVSVAALAIFAHLLRAFWPYVLDDTFIIFRYAENLAAGHGLTWNPGAPPAEGYTCFLWVLLMAVPHALGIEPLGLARGLGVALTLASLAVTGAFAYRLCEREESGARWLSTSAAVLFHASFYPSAAHAVTGMGTALFTFLFQLLLYVATFAGPRPARVGLLGVPLVGLLLGMTRPEGVLVVALVLFVILARAPLRERRRIALWALALLAAPGALYFAWRVSYYGHFFPLSFYVKVDTDRGFAGADKVLGFLVHVALPLGLLFALGLLRQRRNLLPQLVAVCAFLAFYSYPVHRMGMQWRFLAPAFPFLAVVSACGLPLLIERIASSEVLRTPRRRVIEAAVVLLLLPAVSWGLLRDAPWHIRWARNYAGYLEKTHMALGKKLRSLSTDESPPVLAIHDAGAVPYFSRWTTIDIVGLNEPELAMRGRRDAKYVLSKDPDLVVLASLARGRMKPAHGWAHEHYTESLDQGLQVVRTIGGPYYLLLIARPDSAIAAELRAWEPPNPHPEPVPRPADG